MNNPVMTLSGLQLQTLKFRPLKIITYGPWFLHLLGNVRSVQMSFQDQISCRYKAQLVAKGLLSVRELIKKHLAPVAKLIMVRCLLTVAKVRDWPLPKMDIHSAFTKNSQKWCTCFHLLVVVDRGRMLFVDFTSLFLALH